MPLPSTEMKCVDDQGNEVAIGEPGEIIARGPQVMAGYWRQPERNRSNVLRDGWLYTGDIGTMDAEGYFTIVDRRKDMILVSGFNVYPNEVEAVLAGLAGVKECAVIGVPDAASGEAVKAFVVRDDPNLDAAGGARFLQKRARQLQSAEIGRVPRRFAEVERRQDLAQGAAAETRPRAPLSTWPEQRQSLDHQRNSRRPATAPMAATKPIANVYQAATKSGELSGQCVA